MPRSVPGLTNDSTLTIHVHFVVTLDHWTPGISIVWKFCTVLHTLDFAAVTVLQWIDVREVYCSLGVNEK